MSFSQMREYKRQHKLHILPLGRLKLDFINEHAEKSLTISEKEMKYQMEMFSRNFKMVHFANAWKIFTQLKQKGYPG